MKIWRQGGIEETDLVVSDMASEEEPALLEVEGLESEGDNLDNEAMRNLEISGNNKNNKSSMDGVVDNYNCEELQILEEKESCYAQEGEDTGDLSYCEKIKDKTEREKWCYYEIAVEHNNPQACEKITTENWKAACFLVVAGQTGNEDLCRQITKEEQREECLLVANEGF
jgi:hypothetical protein